MAKFLSNSKLLSAFLNRRVYATASSTGPEKLANLKKLEEKSCEVDTTGEQASWVPDPVRGFYRPLNRSPDIDPAELRKLVFSHRNVKPQKP